MMRSSPKFSLHDLLRFAVLVWTFFFVYPAVDAFGAHPLRLTDYSERSRIELEVAAGWMNEPLPAHFQHYLLAADVNVAQGWHLRLAVPFSGYSGVDGADNFIRGNILVGGSYRLDLAEWVSLGFGLRLYMPTYERADSVDFGLPQDPRRAILSHWHYRFQYAFEDSFPVTPELAACFQTHGFFAQVEGGFTWAPLVRERDALNRKDNNWLLNYGLGLGYDLFGYVELNASLTGLVDPNSSGANLGDLLGLPIRRPRSLHAVTIGPRAQYKWAVIRFEASIPLEKRFRDLLDPYYLVALQVQFP